MTKSVTVTIAGRSYRMACGEGEERRLMALGRHVDQTIDKLREDFGEIGDTRLVIMAAVTLADDLYEARRKIAGLESRVTSLAESQSAAEEAEGDRTDEIADAIHMASDRMERILRDLKDRTGLRQ